MEPDVFRSAASDDLAWRRTVGSLVLRTTLQSLRTIEPKINMTLWGTFKPSLTNRLGTLQMPSLHRLTTPPEALKLRAECNDIYLRPYRPEDKSEKGTPFRSRDWSHNESRRSGPSGVARSRSSACGRHTARAL